MNKIHYLLSILFIASTAVAQIPNNYYSNTAGLSGTELQNRLRVIITNGHNAQDYDDLYDLFENSDSDIFYENDNTVLDIYSENPNGSDPYTFNHVRGDRCGNYRNEGDCYNREHMIPQSVFGSNKPMQTDAHHLFPTDGKVNGERSNYPIGNVNNAAWTSRNGSKRGSSAVPGHTGNTFEPIDEFKGDVARVYFYFVTRYRNNLGSFGNYAMFDTSSNGVGGLRENFKNVLYQWHLNDPVSEKEIIRNNEIYYFQGNRNPFVDHPEFVCQIWNEGNCSLSLEENIIPIATVFPNPSSNGEFFIDIKNDVQSIEIYNTNGQLIQFNSTPTRLSDLYSVYGLSQGFYILKIHSDNFTIIQKIIVQ